MRRPSFAIDREWFRFGRDRHDSRQVKSGIGAGIVVARDLNIDRNMQRRGKSLGSMSISSQAPADRAHSRCFPRAAKTPKQCRVARKIQCEGDRISAGLIAMTMKPTKPMGGDTDQQPAFVGSRRPHCRRASYDRSSANRAADQFPCPGCWCLCPGSNMLGDSDYRRRVRFGCQEVVAKTRHRQRPAGHHRQSDAERLRPRSDQQYQSPRAAHSEPCRLIRHVPAKAKFLISQRRREFFSRPLII